jgi:hypothetical protein
MLRFARLFICMQVSSAQVIHEAPAHDRDSVPRSIRRPLPVRYLPPAGARSAESAKRSCATIMLVRAHILFHDNDVCAICFVIYPFPRPQHGSMSRCFKPHQPTSRLHYLHPRACALPPSPGSSTRLLSAIRRYRMPMTQAPSPWRLI